MTFVKNIWYMAAWSEEITSKLFTRRIFDRNMLFLRTGEGAVKAIADRCPHRFSPLSLGERDGDTVICPYHGLTFDGDGKCVRNPFSDRIPAAAKVDSWACEERHDIVWLWGGDPSDADPSLIPDFSMVADKEGIRVIRGYTLLEAPYEFGTDNLMDLSHIEFVHKGSFAGNGVIFAGEHSVVEEGDRLRSNWWIPSISAPPHTQGVYPPEMQCDHWLDMRWDAPASMHLAVGACAEGAERETGIIADQAHILTPANNNNTHYFWASTRTHDLESSEMDEFLRSLLNQAFEDEDKPIIKAAYENLEGQDFWDAKPISLGIDAGGTRARRKIESLLAKEANA